MQEISKQIDECDDTDCIQAKLEQLNQITEELLSIEKEVPKEQEITADDILNSLPNEGKFPPPFENLTKLWTEHELASTHDLKLKCGTIEKTKEAIFDEIEKIYKKGKGLPGKEWPLPLYDCEDTYVNLKEHGTLNEPGVYYLSYNLEFSDEVVWLAYYYMLLAKNRYSFSGDLLYRLGLAYKQQRKSVVTSYSGWIMDYSNDTPTKLSLNRYEILGQNVKADVQSSSYKGHTRIYPSNFIEDPKDKFNSLGKVTEYKMELPFQIVRFYSTSNPDVYVENTILLVMLNEILDERFTTEEVQKFFKEKKFKKTYSNGDITQELEIGYPSMGCDNQLTSEAGAIVLSGDCIDHGGYVVASDTGMTVNGKPVARIGDKVICYKHGITEIVESSRTELTVGKKPVARIGDKTKCGAKLLGGSMDTFAGSK